MAAPLRPPRRLVNRWCALYEDALYSVRELQAVAAEAGYPYSDPGLRYLLQSQGVTLRPRGADVRVGMLRARMKVALASCVLLVAGCLGPSERPEPQRPAAQIVVSCDTTVIGTTVSDDFERPDGAAGPNWAWQSGIAMPWISQGQLGASPTGQPQFIIAWWQPDSFGPDQFSEAEIGPGFSALQQHQVQVFVRRSTSTSQQWRYGFAFSLNTGRWEIKYDGGSPGLVVAYTAGSPPAVGDTLRIEAQGTTLRGYRNGVLMLTGQHATLVGGRPGLVAVAKYGSGESIPRAWAWWRGGDL